MNEKSLTVLEQYEFEVYSSTKIRGAFLCNTNIGSIVLVEYKGGRLRLELLENLMKELKENGLEYIEQIIRTKEGEYICKDYEQTPMIVKTYFEGKECQVKNKDDILKATEQLATLHCAMEKCNLLNYPTLKKYSVKDEMEKHNKELIHIRKYLSTRKNKTPFEIKMIQLYDLYLEKAIRIRKELENTKFREPTLCHGDYQYHNVIMMKNNIAIINFEKIRLESYMKDLYLLCRKVMEKYNWSIELFEKMLNSYEKQRKISKLELSELYYRLSYPEKFWKIVNHYYNNRKSWQPEINLEKLNKLYIQENEKINLLENIENMLTKNKL